MMSHIVNNVKTNQRLAKGLLMIAADIVSNQLQHLRPIQNQLKS